MAHPIAPARPPEITRLEFNPLADRNFSLFAAPPPLRLEDLVWLSGPKPSRTGFVTRTRVILEPLHSSGKASVLILVLVHTCR